MKDIYSSASRVVVWFGDHKTISSSGCNIPKFLEIYDEIYAISEAHKQNDDFEEYMRCFEIFKSPAFALPRQDGLVAMQQFYKLPWFSRIWVVQEVSEPGSVTALMGYTGLDWDFLSVYLLGAWHSMVDTHQWSPEVAVPVEKMTNVLAFFVVREEFESLSREGRLANASEDTIAAAFLRSLQSTACFEATDPKDLVYALLGFLPSSKIPALLRPNYNHTVAEVFHNYARFLLLKTGDLDLLHCERRDITGVPSWAPDWRYRGTRVAGKKDEPLLTRSSAHVLSDDGRTLFLEGINLGKVVDIACTCPLFGSLKERQPPDRVISYVSLTYQLFEAEGFMRMRNLRPDLQKEEFLSIWEKACSHQHLGLGSVPFQKLRALLVGETPWSSIPEDEKQQYILTCE
jgi:Heterokaryon incompatibility protein (HET)